MSRNAHTLIPLALLLMMSAGYIGARERLRDSRATLLEARSYEERYMLPAPETLRTLGLNYRSFTADLAWINALLYFGDYRDAGSKVPPRYLLDYARTVAEVDPDFYPIYEWFNATHIASRAEVSHEDLELVVDFLEQGMARFPQRHELPYTAGLAYIGYSVGRDPQTRIKELTRGIALLERCAALRGCHPNATLTIGYMQDLRRKLMKQSGEVGTPEDRAREIAQLKQLYANTPDQEIRAKLAERLRTMGVSAQALEVITREQVDRLEQLHDARLPYLPVDLWSVVVTEPEPLSP